MKPRDRYTLLMTAARDHWKRSEWRICRDYLRDALTLACERELDGEPWSDRRRWANGCCRAMDVMLDGMRGNGSRLAQ